MDIDAEGLEDQGRRSPPIKSQRQLSSDSGFRITASGNKASPSNKASQGRATGHSKDRGRSAWRSPLTRRILIINLIVLAIPVLGLLQLKDYRDSLILAELQAIKTQATTIALAIGSSAVEDQWNGAQKLSEDRVRNLLRVLIADSSFRARVFDRSGALVGDSTQLGNRAGRIIIEELPPPGTENSMGNLLLGFVDAIINGLPSYEGLPRYVSIPNPTAFDYAETARALEGEAGLNLRIDSSGRPILSVAVPLVRYRQVLAALMITKDGDQVEAAVLSRRHEILFFSALALAMSILLSLYLSRTIARPIRQLAEAADRVRGGIGGTTRQHIPDLQQRRDEIGELSEALIEMTDALHDRLEAIEGFAADVAHEIKNPLTSLRSAVETVARIKDPEQQKKLMSIIVEDVERLDRLISDISDASRLDAELARGDTEEVEIDQLLSALAEIFKATLPEEGPKLVVSLDSEENFTVMGIEGRLGQVLRNLIANAISFSPPDGKILVTALHEKTGKPARNWAVITVLDEGPGIPQGKEKAIFDRFYSERPAGEKFGMHSGLGLSISKQIVEAHGGSLYAENRPQGGAKFVLRLPMRA